MRKVMMSWMRSGTRIMINNGNLRDLNGLDLLMICDY